MPFRPYPADYHGPLPGLDGAALFKDVRMPGSVNPTSEDVDRFTTIIDETFGMQPVMTFDELLGVLEKGLFDLRMQLQTACRDRDILCADIAKRSANDLLQGR